MTSQIRFEGELAIVKFTGSVTVSDIRGMYARMLHSELFHPDINSLWDFSDVFLDIDVEGMAELAKFVVANSHRRSPSRCVGFVAVDSRTIGLLDTYISFVSRYPSEFRIFDTFEAAKLWVS